MFTPEQQLQINSALCAAIIAGGGLFIAWCTKVVNEWRAEKKEARTDRKEIKENSRRAANGSHVAYDKRGDDPKEGI